MPRALLDAAVSPPLGALADPSGRLAIVAVDHRGNLRSAMSAAAGREITDAELTRFKAEVVAALSAECSAVLLDPEFGLEAAATRRAGCGLLLAYEKSGYDNIRPGRRPDLLPGLSVRRLRRAGAQGVKVLLHYSSEEAEEVNREKRAWVERVGAECQAEELPFFLEIVTYDAGGRLAAPAFALRRPELISGAVEAFAAPRYRAAVLKLELPVATAALAAGYLTRAAALRLTRSALAAARQPIVFLSGGASAPEFVAGLELAAEAGAAFAGALCGRAVWQGGIAAFATGGAPRLRSWLEAEGLEQWRLVRDAVARCACPLAAPTASA